METYFTKILLFSLIFVGANEVHGQDTADKTPCTLILEMIGSARKCISENDKGSSGRLNMEIPKDVFAFLTDASKRACVVKCVMEDRNFVTTDGKLNLDGIRVNQAAIPPEMRDKITPEILQPCMDIAANLDPKNCTTYSEFSGCIFNIVVKVFDPAALDCFTKIPAIGPLFALIQSTLSSRGENSTSTGFFKRMRDRVSSTVSDGRSRIDDWIKDIRS